MNSKFLASTCILVLSFPMTATLAFSSLSPQLPRNAMGPDIGQPSSDSKQQSLTSQTDAEVASWRVVLDIGREPLSSMPFDWARSGCRMPLVIPCDFTKEEGANRQQAGSVFPQSDTVSFTGPEGAVVSRVQGGDWELKESGKNNNGGELSFTLTFPDSMARRDVTIDAGSVLTLTGTAYAKEDIDRLNQDFYDAREEVWKLGEELNDMSNRQGAPKKWNESKQKWEKRYPTESPLKQVQKRMQMMAAQAVQQQKNNARPNPKVISEQGSFPGADKGMFLQKEGVVRLKANGAVMGRWSAEPIRI